MPPKKLVITKRPLATNSDSPVEVSSAQSSSSKHNATYAIENAPTSWMLPNRLGFGDWVKNNFKYGAEAHGQPASACSLFTHQRFIKDFMQFQSPNRGLLLYHSVGTGKTRSSISVAEVLMEHMDVMIMLPAALAGNYIDEIRKCGNPLFRNDQHWKFAHTDHSQYQKASKFMQKANVSADVIKKNGGIWYYVPNKESNFSSLTQAQRESLERQLKDMIANKYKFLHYNGINMKRLKEMIEEHGENMFDNKVIIIDEVHNFISRVIGGKTSSVSKKLYQMLMDAKNTKLILLSGTPMINNPIELSFLLNLVKGYIYTHAIKFNEGKPFPPSAVDKVLGEMKTVDFYTIRHDVSEIHINFLPENYIFEDKEQYIVKKVENYKSIEDQIDGIRERLKKEGVALTKHKTVIKKHFLLPVEEDIFEQYFVNYDTMDAANVINNPMLLSRRIQGLVSYYNYYSPEDYPEKLPIEYIELPMSDTQFQKYFQVRAKEIENERKAMLYGRKRNNNSNSDNQVVRDMKNGAMYRSFSRAFCNFVFPENVVRPFPSSIKAMMSEMDTFDEDVVEQPDNVEEEEEVPTDVKKAYTKALQSALKSLTKEDLTVNLDILSPKFKRIIEEISSCPGLSLVYSQFRNVEGVGVLSMSLDAHGYSELKLHKNTKGEYELNIKESDYTKPKYIKFTGNKEESKILLDIFNSEFSQLPPTILEQLKTMHPDLMSDKNYHGKVIRVLMITQSGAEGISLKNVRHVHVMEPYWNDIRIQQVIGRAIRAKSHIALPQNERNVKVFIYKMKLTTRQAEDKLLKSHDESKTSDEYVYSLAIRKGTITNRLMDILRNSAVDCYLHKDFTNAQCFKPLADVSGKNKHTFAQGPIANDMKDSVTQQLVTNVVKKREFVVLGVMKGEKYVYDKESLDVYKESDVIAKNFDQIVGKVLAIENGKAKVKWNKK